MNEGGIELELFLYNNIYIYSICIFILGPGLFIKVFRAVTSEAQA